jgi:hypothetical protein
MSAPDLTLSRLYRELAFAKVARKGVLDRLVTVDAEIRDKEEKIAAKLRGTEPAIEYVVEVVD